MKSGVLYAGIVINQNLKIMNYLYHSFEIRTNKFSILSIEIHDDEQRTDEIRFGIKEDFLFNGFTVCFLVFEFCVGFKVYKTA